MRPKSVQHLVGQLQKMGNVKCLSARPRRVGVDAKVRSGETGLNRVGIRLDLLPSSGVVIRRKRGRESRRRTAPSAAQALSRGKVLPARLSVICVTVDAVSPELPAPSNKMSLRPIYRVSPSSLFVVGRFTSTNLRWWPRRDSLRVSTTAEPAHIAREETRTRERQTREPPLAYGTSSASPRREGEGS